MKRMIFISIFIMLSSLLLSCNLNEEVNRSNVDSNKNEENSALNESKEGTAYNLPLVIIDTDGEKINGEFRIDGNIRINDDDSGLNYLNDKPVLESDIVIKIRGNSTRHFPKKQYGIELRNEENEPRNMRVLDMPKESDWVLNAPFADKSFIRNYMAYSISGEIMEYAPRAKLCEVFLVDDGSNKVEEKHYRGIYVMIEKIKRGEDRVNILPTIENIEETSYIVAKDKFKVGDIEFYTYGKESYIYDHGIQAIYPKNKMTKGNIEYITRTFSEFERVLYSDKYDDVKDGYSKYIDVNSFIDYYIINEFFKNTDAGVVSTYFNKDYGEKIKIGPIWDFNRSMGNHSSKIGKQYEYTGFYIVDRYIFERLLKDIKFVNGVISRYKLLRDTYLSDEYLLEFIDEAVELLGEAPSRNFDIWPIYMCNQADLFKNPNYDFKHYEHDIELLEEYLRNNKEIFYPTDGMATSFEEEIIMLKEFIVNRGKWMDENIESLYKWTD